MPADAGHRGASLICHPILIIMDCLYAWFRSEDVNTLPCRQYYYSYLVSDATNIQTETEEFYLFLTSTRPRHHEASNRAETDKS